MRRISIIMILLLCVVTVVAGCRKKKGNDDSESTEIDFPSVIRSGSQPTASTPGPVSTPYPPTPGPIKIPPVVSSFSWTMQPNALEAISTVPFTAQWQARHSTSKAPVAYLIDATRTTCDQQGTWTSPLSINEKTGLLSGTPSEADAGTCDVAVMAKVGAQMLHSGVQSLSIVDVKSVMPSIVITADVSSPTVKQTIVFTLTPSEEISELGDDDVVIEGATKGPLVRNGDHYTITATEPTATVTIYVAEQSFTNELGLQNERVLGPDIVTLKSVVIDAPQVSIQTDTSLPLAASGIFSDDSVMALNEYVLWSLSDEGVATIDADGLLTSHLAGQVTASATVEGITGTKMVTVIAADLLSISVTPVGTTLGIGGVLQFLATGTYSNGKTQDLTKAVSWTSNRPLVATVGSEAGNKGLASALTAGTATISALHVSSGIGADRNLVVTANTITRIEVSPVYAQGPAGTVQQFYATAIFSNGAFTNVTTSANWVSSHPQIASVANAAGREGRASLLSSGVVTISATLGGQTGTTQFTVVPPALTEIVISPANASTPLGFVRRYHANGKFSDGTERDITNDVTWSTLDSSVANVSNASGQKGFLTAAGIDTTQVRASLNGIVSAVPITVSNAALTSLQVVPGQVMLSKLVGKQFQATATFSDATSFDVTDVVTWSVSDESFGAVGNSYSDKGYFYNQHDANSTPSVSISATLNGQTRSASIVITQGRLSSIHINPTNAQLAPEAMHQFRAFGQYDDGASLDITDLVTWSAGDQAVAAANNAPGYHGLIVAVAEGATPIKAEFDGVAGSSALTVSNGAAVISEEGVGLSGQYWSHTSGAGNKFGVLKGTRIDSQIDFYWGTGNSPLDVGDYFAVRWTGFILIPSDGVYRFCTQSDDGVRLTFDGQAVITNWVDHSSVQNCANSLTLTGGTKYPITLEFYESGGYAEIRLRWQRISGVGGAFAAEIVPRRYLYPN